MISPLGFQFFLLFAKVHRLIQFPLVLGWRLAGGVGESPA